MAPFIFSLANFTPTILIGFKEDLTTKYLDRERSGAMPRLIIYIFSNKNGEPRVTKSFPTT
jgi:hypothetical protein